MKLDIVTIERQVYSADDVDMVNVPGSEGDMGIRARHEPLVTALREGVLEIIRGAERETMAIGGGFLEVRNSHVVILADAAEQADEIDVARAEAARARAEAAIREAPRQEDAEAALHALRRATVRLDVAKRGRRRTGGGERVAD
jgi:F-type H+-transporting ATPase subunit epsilon